jgi:hypothetical protein
MPLKSTPCSRMPTFGCSGKGLIILQTVPHEKNKFIPV